jgi:glycosyltransferase involved in cell wall biosynthesis
MSLKRLFFEYGKDFLIIALCVSALAVVLYARWKFSSNKDRIAPYREPLVPEEFHKTCPPIANYDQPTIVWIVRHYLPDFRTGAVCMAHDINRFLLKAAAWEVIVITPYSTVSEYEGVKILQFSQLKPVMEAVRRAHCIITQYQVIETAAITAQRAKKPLVMVSHDDSLNPWIEKAKAIHNNIYLINNSEWLDTMYRFQGLQSMILYPPVYVKAYVTHTTRRYITLINCNKNKGADLFYKVAAACPHLEFLAIEGSYGDQVAPPRLPNLTAWKSQLDMRRVYSVTGILCVPSKAESWGRVAIEAGCSGIPVIAHPTPGLKEALGPVGIYADREKPEEWIAEIQRLHESVPEYERASKAIHRRANELNPTKQLEEFRNFLLALPAST